ncbi:hypothetical protein N7540_006040 [Penicillium herquei]|nr:hypothetical protein N7540_006040 [Penicillium herquei]
MATDSVLKRRMDPPRELFPDTNEDIDFFSLDESIRPPCSRKRGCVGFTRSAGNKNGIRPRPRGQPSGCKALRLMNPSRTEGHAYCGCLEYAGQRL